MNWQDWELEEKDKKNFFIGATCILISIIASRLWFFIDLPLIGVEQDSLGYYFIAKQIQDFAWPILQYRPPVFPFIVAICLTITDNLLLLPYILCLFSTISTIFMFFALLVWKRRYFLIFSVALSAWRVAAPAIIYDTSLMSDSISNSFLLASYASAILVLSRPKQRFGYLLLSSNTALAILSRPSSMYFVFIYIVIFLHHKNALLDFKKYILLLFPLGLALSLLAGYNKINTGNFEISSLGEMSLAGAVAPFVQTSSDYSEDMNSFVNKISPHIQKVAPIEKIENSADISEFNEMFFKVKDIPTENLPIDYDYYRIQLRRIAIDAIRKYPTLYIKRIFYIGLEMYFQYQNTYHPIFGDVCTYRRYYHFSPNYVDGDNLFSEMLFRLRLFENVHGLISGDELANDCKINITPLIRLYISIFRWHNVFFANSLYLVFYLIALVLSSFFIVFINNKNMDFAIIFALTFSLLVSNLVIGAVQIAYPRFAYGLDWIIYMSPIFVIILLENLVKQLYRKII